ncbi:HAD family hydrolase [Acidaminobacter sp. JC074]|uniref:HAD family hydrolase n=1 Tax=Acidaminobacter sp. JC074 TaxID=2530199 RepID=UPI001F0F24CC|nr:HAD family hydrolase [Acidaminobacter sp. JC074]MCH4888229.1 HAD family hydrolase [Acidaminobacter sp. JC074]
MYKLISLDLDGTLFNDQDQVSKRNMTAIKSCHQNNIETVVATGRPPRFTFGRVPEDLLGGYCICYNGAMIFYNQSIIHEINMDDKLVKEIIQMVETMDVSIKVSIESNDKIYCNFNLRDLWPKIDYEPIENIDYKKVCKILIMNQESLDYDKLQKQFGHLCNMIQTDHGRLIEIMPMGVSKYDAIKWVADKEAICIKEIIAFGDDLNDLEILKGVGLGVAMENGHTKLKEVADHITLSNVEDGVAACLEDIIRKLS